MSDRKINRFKISIIANVSLIMFLGKIMPPFGSKGNSIGLRRKKNEMKGTCYYVKIVTTRRFESFSSYPTLN
jgi:hypothetical protein